MSQVFDITVNKSICFYHYVSLECGSATFKMLIFIHMALRKGNLEQVRREIDRRVGNLVL